MIDLNKWRFCFGLRSFQLSDNKKKDEGVSFLRLSSLDSKSSDVEHKRQRLETFIVTASLDYKIKSFEKRVVGDKTLFFGKKEEKVVFSRKAFKSYPSTR